MERKALSEKILVLGVDGMDPRLTRRYVDEGKMPNTKRLIEQGAQRHDLVMLGGVPTVTPPMWTTLATGAYPVTHGITCFWRQSEENLDLLEYNLDSRLCKAEQLWNVFAENGKKTLVWHWPGASWPPSSDSANLHVVDGTQPSTVNSGVAKVDKEFILLADEKIKELHFQEKAATDSNVPCMIEDLVAEDENGSGTDLAAAASGVGNKATRNILLCKEDGEGSMTATPYDAVLSPIKPAIGWAEAPKDAKEFTILLSHGLIHRPTLILANENGVYDRIAIYKSKKDTEPRIVLKEGEFIEGYLDDAFKNDERYLVNRNMRIFELKADGSRVKMWISSGMDITNDLLWHPRTLFKTVTENIGYPPPATILGGADRTLICDGMIANWDHIGQWQSKSLKLLIEQEKYDVVFSHYHNVDAQGHMIVKYMKDKGLTPNLTEADFAEFLERIYIQTDNYIGDFMDMLDDGWTILIVSDHAQVCPENDPPLIGDITGVNIRVMQELGYTVLKTGPNGEELREIDWEHTKALATRGNHIYLNIKGRNPNGIVEPEDQYELEEEIMTALYGYRDKATGKRVIALALRNKDAVILGTGGPESGDIIYFLAEGYNYDHADSLSTTYGFGGTSVSPIFIAAGKGLKQGFETDRIIREVDVAPTIAVLGGVRMPAQCEGAPVYQILDAEY